MSTPRPIAAAFALALLAAHALAGDGPAPAALGFLEPGRDYAVRFPEGGDPFKTSRAVVSESTVTDAEGKKKSGGPVTMNFTFSVSIFRVVKLGGGSWALLRHPKSPGDFLRWAEQRKAKAILAGPNLKAVRARADGDEQVKRLEEAATAEIPTTETWINLAHAIAIAEVPTEMDEAKISV